MKFFKKLLLLCSTLVMCGAFAFAVACDEEENQSSSSSSSEQNEPTDSAGEEENVTYVYRVTVETVGGYGLRDVVVDLYDGETLIASKTTTSTGNATFKEEDIADLGEYTISLSELPAGYVLADEGAEYVTSTQSGTKTEIALTPTEVIKESAPTNKSYRLGDVMYDFTVTTSDDKTFTLSEVLKEKKAVLLNFWATWCTPCKMEFPAMNNAYYDYRDDVAVLAMSTTDTMSAVTTYKKTSGLHFDMTSSGASLTSMFNTSSIPTSVLIDRYGVVSFYHTGSMTAKRDFTDLFDKFIKDDYTPTILSDGSEINPDGENSEEDNMVIPDIADPDPSAVEDVLCGTNDFTVEWDTQDTYAWPWVISNDNTYIETPNKFAYSYATIRLPFEVSGATAVLFDYMVSTEANADILYVLLDGSVIHQLSGISSDWETCYAYVFDEEWQYGEHELILIYMKDDSNSAGDDIVKVKNLRYATVESLDSPDVNANIFKYAATQENTDNTPDSDGVVRQYKSYITPVYNETDGYYHVNKAEGPILFANMMFPSLWNATSVWMLAYDGYCVADGNNLLDPIEHHSWVANNNMTNNGYTPVTRDLKRLLELVTANVEIGQLWDGETHDKEWLEICIYYQHYGQTPEMADPTETLTFHAAKPLKLGETNMVEIPFAMKPRGFKYSFTPTTSGVYNVYSTGDNDTVCFLIDEDQETFLGTYDDNIWAMKQTTDENGKTTEVPDSNFDFYYYFEANRTYYLLFTTYLDMTATYGVKIEYMGATYNRLTNAAVGPYSANLNNFELFIPDAIDYYYDEANDVYRATENDSIIYLDCLRPTAFFQNYSLDDICTDALERNDKGEFIYEESKRAFYINGSDYTDEVQLLCNQSKRNTGDLKGFVPVTQSVFELLRTITMSEKYEGINDSWLMLCYYYEELGSTNHG